MKFKLFTILFIFESFLLMGNPCPVSELLRNERLSPYDRFLRADSLIERGACASDSVAATMIEDVLLPFCQKYVVDTELKNRTLSKTHQRLNGCYTRMSQYDHALQHLHLSQEHIERTKDIGQKAELWRYSGAMEGSYGNRKRSVEALYRAVKYFELIPGSEQSINACYSQIATPYIESGDSKTVLKIAQKMERVALRSADSTAYYHYYFIMGSHYNSIAISCRTIDFNMIDKGIYYMKRAIAISEKHHDQISHVTPCLWAYYKVAEGYSIIGGAHSKDSVNKYLTLARQRVPDGENKALVSIKWLFAKQYMDQGKSKMAQSELLQILSIIEQTSDNSLVVEKCNTYDFLAEIYESQGNLAQALVYEKLFTEAHLERFNTERNQALCELAVKYETEQKQTQIDLLKQEKRYVESVIIWSVSLLALLLVGLSLLLYIFHLRKRANIQKLYEKAMEAEIRLQTLDGSIKNAAQQIQPNRENLLRLIEKSILEPKIKADYYKRIEELDPRSVETIQQCAKARLSPMDIKYMACFMVGMEVVHVASVFNVEPASVHTVRYRLRKKLPSDMLPF